MQSVQIPSQTIVQSSSSSYSISQIEIPFIPSNQRQSHLASIPDDTIVLVGQAIQKKRKRTKSKDNPSIGDDANMGEDEAFDYATVPNLLDDIAPAPEDVNTRRKKRQKDAKGTSIPSLSAEIPAYVSDCKVAV